MLRYRFVAMVVMASFCVLGVDAQTVKPKDWKGKIEVMTVTGDFMKFFTDKVAPAFKKLYPNVELAVVDDQNNSLDTRLGADNPPDLYTGTFGAMVTKYAKTDKILDLESLSGFTEIEASLQKPFSGKSLDGSYYVPWLATTTMMIYNKDLFKAAGLDPDKPPKTYAELLASAKKISALSTAKTKIYGAAMWNDALSWGGWYWSMMAPMYYSMNQGKYSLLNKTGTDIVFDKPEAKMTEFLTFAKNIQEYSPESLAGNKDFFARIVGIWPQFGYGWKANFKNSAGKPMEIGKDVGVAPIPVLKAGDQSYSVLDGRSLMIFHSTPAKEQVVWDLVKLLVTDRSLYLAACQDLNMLPTVKGVGSDPYFQKPDVKPFVDNLAHSLILDSYAVADPIQNDLSQMYAQVVLLKALSVEDGLAQVAKKAREELKK